jgi:hypothetical protein
MKIILKKKCTKKSGCFYYLLLVLQQRHMFIYIIINGSKDRISDLTRRVNSLIDTCIDNPGGGVGVLFLYLGIHRHTVGMGHLFDQSNISMGCNFHQSVKSMGR